MHVEWGMDEKAFSENWWGFIYTDRRVALGLVVYVGLWWFSISLRLPFIDAYLSGSLPIRGGFTDTDTK